MGGNPRGVDALRGATQAAGLQACATHRQRRHHRDGVPVPPPELTGVGGGEGEPVPVHDEGGGPAAVARKQKLERAAAEK